MRKNIVTGNWKMNLDRAEAISLVKQLLSEVDISTSIQIILSPSYVYLGDISQLCANIQHVSVASQDCSVQDKGAFTGEVAASMLKSCNVEYVILGHSERRMHFAEDNQLLKKKVIKALSNDLKVIFCCGESLEQRNKEMHFDWIKSQLSESLFSIEEFENNISNIIIAYEPIWAIGTGMNASVEQAQEMHGFIRKLVSENYNSQIAENISIIYGGSCNANNASDLFSEPDIDGGLIGGASLSAASFLSIINSF